MFTPDWIYKKKKKNILLHVFDTCSLESFWSVCNTAHRKGGDFAVVGFLELERPKNSQKNEENKEFLTLFQF